MTTRGCAHRVPLTATVSLAAVSIASMLSGAAQAHHSFAKFDQQSIIEVQGEVVDVSWRNPHVHLTVRGRVEGGPSRSSIESRRAGQSPTIARRRACRGS